MVRLVLLQGGSVIPFDLTADETTIGRHPDCAIHLESNMVSRRHARVDRSGERYLITDLGSGNGTIVNGRRITEPFELSHEDRIKLGPILLRFERDPISSSAGSPIFPQELEEHQTQAFHLDLTEESSGTSTVMSTSSSSGGFGLFDVRPEAKLKAILDISRALAGTVDLATFLPKMLETLFGVFPHADRGVVLLKNEQSGRMVPAALRQRQADRDETVRISRTILSRVLTEKTAILSADVGSDSRFESSESISSMSIRSMMCAPLLGLDGEPMGVISIDTQDPVRRFRDDDLDLLVAVAGQAALSYESARLLVSEMEKQKQDDEMRIARNVQQSLLPEKLPSIPGWEFFASYESAQAVGGDYYDCFEKNGTVWLAFGDVAGKGVPGAMIMSRISSVVQTTMAFVHDVDEAITVINRHMCTNALEGRFVTFVLVRIDLKTNEISAVNAGHMPLLIRRPDGSVEEVHEDAVGIPVGIMEDYPYQSASRTIQPGETIVIRTDGVDEAMNPQGELYSRERVLEFVQGSSPRAAELGQALLADVRLHAAGRPQNDDITIMTFGRNAD